MILIEECPLCKSRNLSGYLRSKDYFFSGEPFGISQCDACGFLFTNPRPQADKLQNYYESEKYLSHTDKTDSLFSVLYQWVKKYALRKKLRILESYVKTGSLLDVGCGTGEYIALAKKNGWHAKGVEQNEEAKIIAKQKSLEVFASIGQIAESDEKFDAITLWHVLEHLPDLHNTMKILSENLKNNGVLIIALPNFKCWDAQHYKEFWAAYDLPRHLYHFNRSTIRTLLSKYGFQLKATLPMVFDAFYVSILSEQYNNNKLAMPMAALKGFWSNLKAWKSKEYSSLIFVFQRNS